MECTFAEAAAVAPGGAAVNFEVVFQGQSLECSIARDVLEQYFWAPIGGSDAQLLHAYAAGRSRIEAMVVLRLRRHPSNPVVLVDADCNHGGCRRHSCR
jgi:Protein of unknown function (DUF1488)